MINLELIDKQIEELKTLKMEIINSDKLISRIKKRG